MTRRRAERLAWIVGGVGLVATVVGWIVAPSAFPHAWLAAVTVWMGWPLGCMGLLLIHALTGGRWGVGDPAAARCRHGHAAAAASGLDPVDDHACPRFIRGRERMRHCIWTIGFISTCRSSLGRGIVYLIVWFGLAGLILRALRQTGAGSSAGANRAGRADPAGDHRHLCGDRHDDVARSALRLQRLRSDRRFPRWDCWRCRCRCSPPPSDCRRTKARMRSLGGCCSDSWYCGPISTSCRCLIVWQSDLAARRPGTSPARPADGASSRPWWRRCHFVLPFFALICAASATLAAWDRRRGRAAGPERGRPWLVAGGAGVWTRASVCSTFWRCSACSVSLRRWHCARRCCR